MLPLSAAAATFLLALGFAIRDENLKFAGLSALLSVVLVALSRQLRKVNRG